MNRFLIQGWESTNFNFNRKQSSRKSTNAESRVGPAAACPLGARCFDRHLPDRWGSVPPCALRGMPVVPVAGSKRTLDCGLARQQVRCLGYDKACRPKFQSPDGEIGRRSGLKIRRPQGRGGSNPPPGTNTINTIQRLPFPGYNIKTVLVPLCFDYASVESGKQFPCQERWFARSGGL